jgi:hypothetical protein
MNKKEKEIYHWLMAKPGYLKKSALEVQRLYFKRDSLQNVYNALLQARKDTKNGVRIINSTTENVLVKAESTIGLPTSVLGKYRHTPGTYYVTGCAHAPWQNKLMYDKNINFLKKEVDLEGIILAGDCVDLNSLSSHDKGKTPIPGVTLSWEYEEANKFLDLFDELKINGTKDYIYGNHEDRYLRLMKNNDEAKYGSSLKSPEEGLKLAERGYNVYKDWKNDAIHLGNHLDICHGEFLNIHSAKKTIDTYRKSCLYFHTHRFQIYVEGLVGGFNMGFGGDITAPIFGFATRAMKNSWVNSSCLVTLDKNGYYHVEPLMFINNKLIVAGKEY